MMGCCRITKISRVLLILCLLFGVTASAIARPQYETKENQTCTYCHYSGTKRNFRGLYYARNGHSFASFDELFEARQAGVRPNSDGEQAMARTAGYPDVSVPAVLAYVGWVRDGSPIHLGRYQGQVIVVLYLRSLDQRFRWADWQHLSDALAAK